MNAVAVTTTAESIARRSARHIFRFDVGLCQLARQIVSEFNYLPFAVTFSSSHLWTGEKMTLNARAHAPRVHACCQRGLSSPIVTERHARIPDSGSDRRWFESLYISWILDASFPKNLRRCMLFANVAAATTLTQLETAGQAPSPTPPPNTVRGSEGLSTQ